LLVTTGARSTGTGLKKWVRTTSVNARRRSPTTRGSRIRPSKKWGCSCLALQVARLRPLPCTKVDTCDEWA
jgi:hypothetical protein